MTEHRESPIRRVNPSGDVRWVARWTDKTGQRRVGLLAAGVKGTYKLRRDAQAAINACYELDVGSPSKPRTVRSYFATWLNDHPRGDRTAMLYRGRVGSVLDVGVHGKPFGDWLMADIRRTHARRIETVMLTDHGRAASGARGVFAVLHAMWQDAIEDEYVLTANPFTRMGLRSSDPRIQKPPREISVWTWDEMHRFAQAAGERDGVPPYAEAMIRVLSDCGLRMGELLALERRHLSGDMLEVRQTAWRRQVMPGTKTDHGKAQAGRTAPLPPRLEAMLRGLPRRIDSRFLFPYTDGWVWHEEEFRRQIWRPAVKLTGMNCTPHEFRHSWVTLMREADVNIADLADAAGHTVETATKHYTHATRRSFDAMRRAVEEA